MAKLLSSVFVCAHQKKGTLTVYREKKAAKLQKQGGNVVGYVCTPEGRVIHVIPAAPPPAAYLRELRWARDLAARFEEGSPARRVALAHRQRARLARGRPLFAKVHTLLARRPLPDLKTIEREVFEKILGQVYDPDRAITLQLVDTLPLEFLWYATASPAVNPALCGDRDYVANQEGVVYYTNTTTIPVGK